MIRRCTSFVSLTISVTLSALSNKKIILKEVINNVEKYRHLADNAFERVKSEFQLENVI
ncbi:unnamed protein product, partial [marine sediment metagenome]